MRRRFEPRPAGIGATPPTPRLPGRTERTRRAMLSGLLLAFTAPLASCGFRLRGTQQLPFDSVFIEAPPTSSVGPELARSIRSGTSTRVLDDRSGAAAVIEIIAEDRSRDVAAVDAQGRAREYRLRLRTVFRVRDGKGRELLGTTTLTVTRDLFAREEQLLAREYEESQLYEDMKIEVGQQMLRRLAALKP